MVPVRLIVRLTYLKVIGHLPWSVHITMVMADLVGCTGLLVYKYATNEPDKNAGLGGCLLQWTGILTRREVILAVTSCYGNWS